MKRVISLILVTIFTLLICMCSVFAAEDVLLIAPKPESSISFSDVDKTTTAGHAIYKLADAGILVGDGDGKFRPDDSITRAELSKVVNIIFNYTEKAETGFKDLSGSEWYYDYVLAAKKAGYIVGYDDGTFRGEANVTREEVCAILCRVGNLFDVLLDFEITDDVSDWAVPYVQKALSNGLMTLETDNKFRATQNITRAEFATTFSNFVQTPEKEEDKPEEKPEEKPTVPKPSGGGGGGGGGSITTKPETDYEKENSEMLKNLKVVSDDIAKNIGAFKDEKERKIIEIVKECVDLTIKAGDKNIINTEFLKKTYASEIEEIKGYLEDKELQASLQETVAINLKIETIQWLAIEFGLM